MSNINTKVGDVGITLNLSDLDGRVKKAQQLLNMQIAADSDPYIPFSQGALRNSIRYPDGISGGTIVYDTPYAHYQYEGIVYGPNFPQYDDAGNVVGWKSPPKKYPTERRLQYSTPGTGDHWFEQAKKEHLQDWIKLVQDTIGD